MIELLAVSWKHYAFSIPLGLLSVFLMLVILVQRGRGGGLTGALGGMGGQSAFGTKAGDLFTRITIAVATVWILLCMLAIKVLNDPNAAVASPPPPAQVETKDSPKSGEADATKAPDGKGAESKTGDSDKSAPSGTGSTTPAPAGTTDPAAASAPATPAATPAPATTPPADDAAKTKP